MYQLRAGILRGRSAAVEWCVGHRAIKVAKIPLVPGLGVLAGLAQHGDDARAAELCERRYVSCLAFNSVRHIFRCMKWIVGEIAGLEPILSVPRR